MSDAPSDTSPFVTQLSGLAWALALVAAVALGRLVVYASADDAALTSTHLVWLAVCVLSGCFSVGAFVLAAVRRAESQLALLMRRGDPAGAPATGR